MSAPLDWSHRLSDVPDGGLRVARSASEAERSALAQALEVIACDEAKVEYVISAIGAGRYRMSGEVAARLEQRCVVTLDPLPTQLVEAFDVEFWPRDTVPGAAQTELEVLGLPEVEPIERGRIDAGRVVFETLASALDPFPRKDGASLDWREGSQEVPEPGTTGPFAKLKALKKDR